MKDEHENLFGKIYGNSASWDGNLRLILHAISIPFSIGGLYADWSDPGLSMGLSWRGVVCLCLLASVAIQLVVLSREEAVAKQIMRGVFKKPGHFVMFFISVSFMGAGIWTNHQLSQRGRQYGIEQLIGEAGSNAPDSLQQVRDALLMEVEDDYRADTLLAGQVLAQALKSNQNSKAAHRFRLDKVWYTVSSAREKAKAVKSCCPLWSAGIRERANTEESGASSKQAKADAEARRVYAQALERAAERYRAAESRERATLAPAFARFESDEARRRESHAEARGLVDSSMYWLVIVFSFGSFIICLLKEGYRVHSGQDLEGEVYEPRNTKSLVYRNLSAFVDDAFEVVGTRLGETRAAYTEKNKNKGAYRLPDARYVVGTFLFVATGFAINQTSIFSAADMAEAKMIPQPWGFVMLFCCLVGLAFFGFHEVKAKVAPNLSEPVPDLSETTANLSEPVRETTPKPAETVVRQQSQAGQVAEDNVVSIMSTDEINKAKDRCRKAYVRQFVSATDKAQADNADRFRQEREALRNAGYKVTATGPLEKRTVKVDGKPKVVTFKRLIISE